MVSRYIVWQEANPGARCSVSDLLGELPEVEILRAKGPDHAVVMMEPEIEERIRAEFPQLSVERDIQHRMIAVR